ncbi:URC4/urg3 family protein [Mycobacterium sp. 155]|uniref:URC4/urg3 family protein n=1 Tax=Mycobacterium sp. 155 TaxID=1157943 RepID=UPI00037B7BD8|nr:URC4/urg3 family protein [Mycobacterium sp. 155]
MTAADTETDAAVATLRTTGAIRERAGVLLQRARAGRSPWFVVDDDALPHAVAEVVSVTRERYPDLRIPYHSRWRHFEAGGLDRKAELDARLADLVPAKRARTLIDLTVISVLLDAGAGPSWQYRETVTGQRFARSEGLAVASWHAFLDGTFSSDPTRPWQADAIGLATLQPDALARAFQVDSHNPLVGLDGRVQLLHRLGAALAAQPEVFGQPGRPGGLFDTLGGPTVTAHTILSRLLTSLSGIWLADNAIDGQPLGDCWPHPAVPGDGPSWGWMPFHKLSQWLTYSLLEPLEWAGVHVSGLEALTGLPEYRNGGLLLDTAVLQLRKPEWAARTWSVGDELVVEWRALTVALLDELAAQVRTRLGAGAERLPLACVLEGGTWAAGRRLAGRLRAGRPPLAVSSDGTVF